MTRYQAVTVLGTILLAVVALIFIGTLGFCAWIIETVATGGHI
jgi:nitrate reductase NapE component